MNREPKKSESWPGIFWLVEQRERRITRNYWVVSCAVALVVTLIWFLLGAP